MFLISFVKIYLFITLVITIFVDQSLADSGDKAECFKWNEYCDSADKQSNPRFKCKRDGKNSIVFYYEKEKHSWDKARQLCSQKFYGSYLADLIELSDGKRDNAVEMMKKLAQDPNSKIENLLEMPTNGICCMRKKAGQIPSSENKCQWLSSGSDIKLKNLNKDDNQCSILIVKFDKNKGDFDEPTTIEKSQDLPFPYLCAYNAPKDCVEETIKTTTKATFEKTTEHKNTGKTEQTTQSSTSIEPSNSTDKRRCNQNHEYDDRYIYNITKWEPVFPNETSESSCPQGYNGKAYWFCNTDSKFDPKGPNITCTKEWLNQLYNDITDESNTEQIVQHSSNLAKKLNNESLIFYGELNTAIRIINEMHIKIVDNDDRKRVYNFTANIVESCSTLLDKTMAWNNSKPEQRISLGSKILEYIQNSAFILGCQQNNNRSRNPDRNTSRIQRENIVIDTFAMNFTNQIKFQAKDSSILVPEGIEVPEKSKVCGGTAIGAKFEKLSKYLSAHLDSSHHEINSNIIAFSYTNSTESVRIPDGLKVQVIVKHNELLKFGDKIECVFWEFNQSEWSRKGCIFHPINSNRRFSICECDHFTNFAALMDVSGREKDSKVKSVLTIVCSMISSICLLLTIGFLTLFPALRNRRSTITCNLCVCLLIANILVAFGMDRTDLNNDPICKTISALLLYSLLASFSWMLMEGYHLYQMIVLVFSNIGHLRLIWLYAIGYGAPLVVFISALLGIGFDGLKGEYFCWISSTSHPYNVWALAGPATFVILANCLIMFLALKAAFSAKVKKNEPKEISEINISQISGNSMSTIAAKFSNKFSWMKGYISLVVLMGITWLSYVFYIHEYGSWFSYVFIVFNGLQGFFIFTLQILLNEKARQIVRKNYHKRHPSRYFSSLYKTNSTNMFTSMRSKSISARKVSNEGSNSSNSNRVSVANSSQNGSHRSQSISIPRIRNASDSILF